ncbi:Ger(x)C family spore germination C-terminal domain-containing protein, partial [Paenibacillus sp. TAF58]
VGLLNNDESMATLWVIGRLKLYYLTTYVPEGKGFVTVDETNLHSHITTDIVGGKPSIHISLSGVGTVRENDTSLDISDPKQLAYVENAMNRHVQRLIKDTVRRVQKDYSADIFGFGEKVHQQHANEWKLLRKDWEKEFQELGVTIKVQTNLKRIGIYGPRPQQGNIFF